MFNKEKFNLFIESKLFYLYFLVNYFNEKRLNKKYMKKFYANCPKDNILDFSFEELKQNKKSDTLFILGSGSSINNISKEMWEHIKEHDSFGFNFWLLHDHIPTYFMFEPPSRKETIVLFKNLLNKKIKEYQNNNTYFLMKDFKSLRMRCNDLPDEIISHFTLLPKDDFYGSTKENFIRSLRLSKKLNLLSRDVVYSRRASLFSTIYIAWKLGYKNIVLAGIDLNNTDYFYDIDEYSHYNIPENPKKGKVHATAKESDTDFKIDELVYMLKSELLDTDDRNLFVLNEKSLLAEKLPVYTL